MRILLSLLLVFTLHAGFGQGLLFDQDNYNRMPLAPMGDNTKSLTNKTPTSKDLTLFVPPVVDQGDLKLCVPISTLYYATGTRLAYKNQISGNESKQGFAASPMYNFLRKNLKCNAPGVDFTSMMYDLIDRGSVPFTSFTGLDCGNPYQEMNYVIKGVKESESRFCGPADDRGNPSRDCNDPYIIKTIKEYVSNGYPVVVGLKVDLTTLENVNSQRNVYQPRTELSTEQHAMTIVGYDRDVFTLVNSWGPNKGGDENGLFKVLGEDLQRTLMGAFIFDVEMVGQPTVNSTNATTQKPAQALSVAMNFNKLMGSYVDQDGDIQQRNEIQPVRYLGNGHYVLAKSNFTKVDEFQAVVNNLTPAVHMAVISMDADSHKVLSHWPRNEANVFGSTPRDILPVSNMSYILPSPDKLFTITGGSKDYLIVLLSQTPLASKMKDIMSRLENYRYTNDPIHKQLYAAIGDEMIDTQNINYQKDKMEATVSKSSNATILPLIMEINHSN